MSTPRDFRVCIRYILKIIIHLEVLMGINYKKKGKMFEIKHHLMLSREGHKQNYQNLKL